MTSKKQSYQLLLQYTGLAFQWLALLLATIFLGKWIDGEFFEGQMPIFSWLLPLLAIVGGIIKVVKDTSAK
ncbi:MAG: hypothetical protein MUE72_11325 [Chitinophagaceae bacterium]|jgi:hypothetical protein|nr:hypothetical protein [Hydrotalea sp.]MCU0323000.1 hypothetical protein [Chitinophagaceae bacterium]